MQQKRLAVWFFWLETSSSSEHVSEAICSTSAGCCYYTCSCMHKGKLAFGDVGNFCSSGVHMGLIDSTRCQGD